MKDNVTAPALKSSSSTRVMWSKSDSGLTAFTIMSSVKSTSSFSRKRKGPDSYEYFDKVKELKEFHSKYSIRFLRTLIQLEKFEEAFAF